LIRLHLVVEEQTEEAFVNEILAPELSSAEVFVDAHSITTGRKGGRLYRGGGSSYEKLRGDVVRWMKQDRNADSWFTAMIDFYRFPGDFPGRDACGGIVSVDERVACLERQFELDIGAQLGDLDVQRRFIPYIQLHEFEAILFSDATRFAHVFPEQPDEIQRLLEIRSKFVTPEDIDDGPETSPSKRILKVLPDFVKTVSGILIAKQIGLDAIRGECPHFSRWLSRILEIAELSRGSAAEPED
jgi:uncharacterized protein DUF4276